jgi:RNA polymerase sigma-70 factor (ECF subfamily)
VVDVLAGTFVDVSAGAWAVSTRDRAMLERELGRIGSEGARAWPGVVVDPVKLTRYLAERAPDDTDPLDALAAMQTSDLYLALACLDRDEAALAHFERAIVSGVAPAVSRIDATREFARQIEEEIRVKMLAPADGSPPRLGSYIGRGPLKSWVQVAAIRAAYSEKRSKPKDSVEDVDKLAALPFEGEDAELARIRGELAEPFRRAFDAALRALAPRERNVLRMYVVEGLGPETIGRMYNVHRATVHRWIAHAQESLVDATKRALARDLQLSGSELDSVVRFVHQNLDFSIASALD